MRGGWGYAASLPPLYNRGAGGAFRDELRYADTRAGKLGNLRELYLRNNRLRELPSSLGKLKELRRIDLRGNPLKRLPEEMRELRRLEKIGLRWVSTLEETDWLGELEARGCLVYR